MTVYPRTGCPRRGRVGAAAVAVTVVVVSGDGRRRGRRAAGGEPVDERDDGVAPATASTNHPRLRRARVSADRARRYHGRRAARGSGAGSL